MLPQDTLWTEPSTRMQMAGGCTSHFKQFNSVFQMNKIKRCLSSTWFIPQMTAKNRGGTAWSQSFFCVFHLDAGSYTPGPSSAAFPGMLAGKCQAGLEEQPGLEPLPLWASGLIGFACSTTLPHYSKKKLCPHLSPGPTKGVTEELDVKLKNPLTWHAKCKALAFSPAS